MQAGQNIGPFKLGAGVRPCASRPPPIAAIAKMNEGQHELPHLHANQGHRQTTDCNAQCCRPSRSGQRNTDRRTWSDRRPSKPPAQPLLPRALSFRDPPFSWGDSSKSSHPNLATERSSRVEQMDRCGAPTCRGQPEEPGPSGRVDAELSPPNPPIVRHSRVPLARTWGAAAPTSRELTVGTPGRWEGSGSRILLPGHHRYARCRRCTLGQRSIGINECINPPLTIIGACWQSALRGYVARWKEPRRGH